MTDSQRPIRDLPRGKLTAAGRAELLASAKEIAEFEGGRLISEEVESLRSDLEWECDKEHRWTQSLKSVRSSKRWCPECRSLGIAPDQIQELARLKAHAESLGGRCLSESYLGSKLPLDWECSEGHPFSDHANKIWNRARRGGFCPECGKKRRGNRSRLTLEDLRRFAETERGGKCLAAEYINAREDVEWECSNKHRFWKNANRVIHQGDWCADCAGNAPVGIKWFKDYAIQMGGVCLSHDLKSMKCKLHFRCEVGHDWYAKAGAIRFFRSWCPRCAFNAAASREDVEHLAAKFGGRCLGKAKDPRGEAFWIWECSQRHRWKQKYSVVKRGHWCAECSGKLGERICRAFMEAIFGVRFAKCRPPWLLGERGVPLELDGFSEELLIAFEHQGQQHYRKIEHFGGDLSEIQGRDRLKAEACAARGVRLVLVPEIGRMTSLEDLPSLLEAEFCRLGIQAPVKVAEVVVDLAEVYATPEEIRLYEDLGSLVDDMGGVLLSSRWLGAEIPHQIRCERGHEFSALVGNLRKGKWCSHEDCKSARLKARMAETARRNLERVQKAAADLGGRCLSEKFLGWKAHHDFECGRCGLRWSANAGNLVWKGTWCKRCGVEKMLKSRAGQS